MKDKKILMSLDEIMGDRFGKYSKYIIQDRALPDVRDGLKPVQRRILYAMFKEGNTANKPYRKSAKTVGNVIGNYHPHGDTSVYDAMVRLSQEWKMRIPLIDMQGNNGSIDNDPAAAMRYTEARLSKIAVELLKDIDKETVLMSLNFDDTEYEPTVLPAKYPNLLVNGATGISAGYATDIPPHNLEEVIDATIYRIKHPKCTFEDLHTFVKGPDFPTGAIVEGKAGIINALKYGKGKVVVRSKVEIVEEKNINKIVVSEIPYEVNKAELVRKIDEIRFNKSIDGIIEVRDESDRNGLSIVVDLKKDVNVQNTLNYFYKNTDLQKNYNYNMVAIKDRKPILMGLVEILDGYIQHQIEVVTKRSLFDLNKAEQRKHIVDGLIKAVSILDEVVKTIRHSKDKSDAKINLETKYGFSEKQSEAIVMLQLYRLTNTDIVLLQNELKELNTLIKDLEEILNNEKVLRKVIINELKQIKIDYPTPRLTEIKDEILEVSVNEEDMFLPEDIYVTVTKDGYIKRVSQRSFGASVFSQFGKKDDDYLCDLHYANTLDKLLVFTNKGNYMYIPIHKLEEFKWRDLGKHISYLVKLSNDEKIIKTILVKSFDKDEYVLLASAYGQVKRVLLKEFEVIRYSKPIKCMNLKKDDELVGVSLTDGHQAVVLVSQNGYATMYDESEISVLGIKAGGIRGINLKEDTLISLCHFNPLKAENLVLLSHQGGIKRMHIADIPPCNRATKGTLLFKNLKTKISTVHSAYILPINSTLNIYNEDMSIELTVKDYTYSNQDSKFSNIKDFQGDISYVYVENTLTTDLYDSKEEKNKETIHLKEKKVKKETVVNKTNDQVDTGEIFKNKDISEEKEEKFEPISFEDLFNDDF
ncbi:MAG: DNA topoisomerase IV subunit A [Bacilli bacterium]|nr:DNA topoisomerase IV subunit A [Bacilli bacterium]